MAGTRWYRLLVLMLLGVVLGWPLLGSAPSVAGASVHLAGPVPDGCDDCNGCESSPGSEQTCPTTMCPVVQAVVPTLDLDWPRTRAWLLAASDEQGRDHIPSTQAPPPRAIHLA
jgi:hypothetical protein